MLHADYLPKHPKHRAKALRLLEEVSGCDIVTRFQLGATPGCVLSLPQTDTQALTASHPEPNWYHSV